MMFTAQKITVKVETENNSKSIYFSEVVFTKEIRALYLFTLKSKRRRVK